MDKIKIYIFGNGNIRFSDFQECYINPLTPWFSKKEVTYLVGDFRGADTLAMEILKTLSGNVSVYHVGEKPRYMPDKFKTKVNEWNLVGGFKNDTERDNAAIEACTHFVAIDFNSNQDRKSGTQKNIANCLRLGKIRI